MLLLNGRRTAQWLLAAALIMQFEMGCSHAPPPPSAADLQKMGERNDGAVVRFHTVSGLTYVTSQYSTTDSTLVINSILRDPKYYRPTEARLFGEGNLQPPPKETVLPVDIRFTEIRSVDEWQPRSVAYDVGGGLLIVGLIVLAAVAAFAYAISHSNWGGID